MANGTIKKVPSVSKADKADTVLDTTLSRGRKENTTVGERSFAFGYNVEASGLESFAIGRNTQATGQDACAEGFGTHATNTEAHAEGYGGTASGMYSHVEGSSATASASGSHAEGTHTEASGSNAHSEGSNTHATGVNTHAEGNVTTASGNYSHAEGNQTVASGVSSHAEGVWTIASNQGMHACGMCNTEPTADEIFAIGNGANKDARSNAMTVYKDGDAKFAGDVYANGTDKLAKDSDLSAVEDSLAEVNKNVYATVTDVQTVPGGFVINCETDEEYALQAGDILYAKYTDDVQTVNASNQYTIRLSDQNGGVYFTAVIGNIGATEYPAGITVFENGHTYAYYYNGTNLQVVGLDVVDLSS